MSFYPKPSRGLAIASGLAQGVERGMTAYYQREQANQQLMQQQQLMQATAELRRMQMMKLQQEVMPQAIDAAKINALVNGVDHGVPGADAALSHQWKKALDGVQTPAQAQVFSQFMRGLGAQRAPVQLPEQAPDPGAQRAPDAPPEQAAPAAPQTFNRAEQEIIGKIYQGRIQQNIAGAANQNRIDVANIGAKSREELLALQGQIKEHLARLEAATKENVAKIGAGSREKVAETNAGARVKSAEINAKSRVDAAKLRGSSKAKDPVEASILKQIEGIQKSMNDFNKPPNGLSMELPGDRAKRQQGLRDEYQKLIKTYESHTGRPYPGTSPSGAQPAAGGSGPTPPAKAMSLQEFKAAPKGSVPIGTIVEAPGGVKYKVIDAQGNAEPVK